MEIVNRTLKRITLLIAACSVRLAVVMVLTMFISLEAGDIILSIRQSGTSFKNAYDGLKEELQNDFEVREYIVDKKSTVENIQKVVHTEKPKLVVLMDNMAIALYRKYQSTLTETDTVTPSISIMGIMIKDAINGLKNATGISYEIPIVTSAVNLRSIVSPTLNKVGVIHREYLNDFISQNAVFCKREGIDLISVSLPNKNSSYTALIKNALQTLDDKKIDVIWIPNDNVLLQPNIIRSVWIPMVKKMKIPAIVGIEVLVNPKLNFGTFAVLPDHIALGNQAAEMVYEIMDNNWQCTENHVDPPLAIIKILNLRQAKRMFTITDDNLRSVDKKLK